MALPNSKIFDLRGRNLRLETREDALLYIGELDASIVEEIYLADVTFGVGAAEALGEVIKKIKHLKVRFQSYLCSILYIATIII